MYRNKDSCKVQQCRQNRPDNNVGVRYTHKIRHKECGSSHDRRHDLSTCGRSSFYCSGKFRFVACVLHHRDCNRTGCYCVTYRGTGYHSTECRTDNRYLGRSTCIFSCNAVSQLNKEVGDSCSLQKRTENNKYHNIFRAYIYRCGENTLFCVEKIPHQEFHSSQKCRIGKPYSQCIDQEKTCHKQDRQAHASSGKLDQCSNTDNTDHNLIRGKSGTLIDDLICRKSKIQKSSCACDHKNNVANWHVVFSDISFFRRIGKKSDKNDQPQKRSQSDFLQEGGK